jgi:hypothetical protein
VRQKQKDKLVLLTSFIIKAYLSMNCQIFIAGSFLDYSDWMGKGINSLESVHIEHYVEEEMPQSKVSNQRK